MLESNREAVIAIQGGGVWGLSLLGQAKAVLDNGYVPLAWAGTSAGAILATLLWSGLRPEEIETEFTEMASQNPQGLMALLAPFEPPPNPQFDFDAFLKLQANVQRLLNTLPDVSPSKKGRIKRAINAARTYSATAWHLLGLWSAVRPHIERRGLFRGEALESTIDRLIRRGLRQDNALPPGLVRFGDVERVMHASAGGFYRPPLLMTATNLSHRRLDVISSIDKRCLNVPIAAAVRASAGYPIFFRPREIPEAPRPGYFVDGGVVSNFPVWAFSDAFREQMASSDFYRPLAIRPWIRLGLRVVDDNATPSDLRKPDAFVGSLFRMLTGVARNELEDILSDRAARSIVIRQPVSTTAAPENILDVKTINGEKVGTMVARGFKHASEHLREVGTPGVYKPMDSSRSLVEEQLQSLVGACESRVGAAAAPKFRASVFVPVQNRLKMAYRVNMSGDSDDWLEFPSLTGGLTGTCYQFGSRVMCNLEKITELRRAQPTVYQALFEMPPELQNRVRKDRTWLACVPIFDPYEAKPLTAKRARYFPRPRNSKGSIP